MMDPKSAFLSRRTLLKAATSASVLTAALPLSAATVESSAGKTFPKGFLWGVATSAHQIEGNNTNSDYWFLENIKPTTFSERSGDACDSYHRYEEDIRLLATLGFNTYRFSIEWARIEPSPGQFSIAELDYYRRVVECCRTHGIKPAVTFYHGTSPRWFAMQGGWLSTDAPALFSRYCSRAAKGLADEIEFAFTINEPQVSVAFHSLPAAKGYFLKQDAPSKAMHDAAAKALNVERFVSMEYPDIDGMTPQLLAGHVQGYQAIKAEKSDLQTGVTLNVIDFEPGGELSPYEEIRRKAYGVWLEAVRRTEDFTGVQVYYLIPIPGTGKPYPPLPEMPYVEKGNPMAAIQRPEALKNSVEYIHAETKKPIFVTENGIETDNDQRRIWYIDQALSGLHEAIAGGVPVLGYVHWSLLDNYEWARVYKPKYGLVEVDRITFKRKPKPSAGHLGRIAARNGL